MHRIRLTSRQIAAGKAKMKHKPITVQRKISPLGNRDWYYSGGAPVSMAEPNTDEFMIE